MNKENKKPLVNGKNYVEMRSTKGATARFTETKSPSKNDQYKFFMKYLIATNSEYFQNKIMVNRSLKQKDAKLKIPLKTGPTVYKKDFHQQEQKYQNQQVIKHSMSVDCIKTNNFLKDQPINLKLGGETTMYQSDFKFPARSKRCKKNKKRYDTMEDQDAPRFFETQNKLDFLNWAGKNFVPSMKPQSKPAVTNAQFQASTVYKADFEGKSASKTPLFRRDPAIGKFGCASPNMKTSYNNEFSMKKKDSPEIDCKPKQHEATICKKFRGSTEYKRQYIKTKKQDQENEFPTVEELQTLIIDL